MIRHYYKYINQWSKVQILSRDLHAYLSIRNFIPFQRLAIQSFLWVFWIPPTVWNSSQPAIQNALILYFLIFVFAGGDQWLTSKSFWDQIVNLLAFFLVSFSSQFAISLLIMIPRKKISPANRFVIWNLNLEAFVFDWQKRYVIRTKNPRKKYALLFWPRVTLMRHPCGRDLPLP